MKSLEEQVAHLLAENARLKSEAEGRAAAKADRLEGLAEFSLEVRPPLNAILGYCELLLREEGSRLTAHGRRDLGTIRTNTKTVLSLLGDLLDLSQMEAGRFDVNVEEVRVDEIVDEAVATARGLLRGKEVDLTAEIGDEALRARTDGHKLTRIIDKLLATAARSTEAGEILLLVRGRDDGALEIAVEDTGVGISAGRLPHVFERFRPGDGSSADERRTSVDLAMVRQTARILGGDATATSELGRGSKFTVVLPGALTVNTSGPTSARPAPPPRADDLGTRRSILVVDDDPLLRAQLRGTLTDHGFEVLESGATSDGVSLARRERPGAILLDVHPPALGGWQFLEEVKTDPSLAAVPIVALAVGDAREKAFCFGSCEFLAKPVDDNELIAVAVRALGGTTGEVLVLDEQRASADRTLDALVDAGFVTYCVTDAPAALARIRERKPALVVVDLATSRIGAFEVLAALRSSGNDVPVIALSPRRLGEADLHTVRDGFAHVVAKSGKALAAAIADAEPLLRGARFGQGRIPKLLYVEDSPQNRDIVRRYLKGLFFVLEAEDGEHGIERARREQPDIILMDLSLPRIDGWEATKRIKALPPLGRTPVVALSAHVGRDDRERARTAGCVDYLTKPIERGVLVQTLRKHLAAP